MPSNETVGEEVKQPAAEESKVAKKATVTIERDKLDAILNRLERLESSANKAALNRYDEANKEVNPGTEAGIKTYEGKRIVSYVMTANTVEKRNGVWIEDQQIELTFEDGETTTLPYKLWATRYAIEKAEIIGKVTKTRREDLALYGEYIAQLKTADGTELSIGAKYLNG